MKLTLASYSMFKDSKVWLFVDLKTEGKFTFLSFFGLKLQIWYSWGQFVLHKAFTQADPESAKKIGDLTDFFVLLASV